MKIALALVATLLPLSAQTLSDRTFNVRQHGAAGDGKTLDTAAIQKSIDAAAAAGGGIVVFPPGTYLSSSIHLLSHVTLQVEKDATLLGSPDRKGYQKAHFFALIVAEEQSNIGIRGQGTIDGNGKLLNADAMRLVKEGALEAKDSNRPTVIHWLRCKNVSVRDVTLRDSSFWVQDYRECEDLLIENITVRSNVEKTTTGSTLPIANAWSCAAATSMPRTMAFAPSRAHPLAARTCSSKTAACVRVAMP